MRLKDKVAIIAGAGPGIGRATALLFAQQGAKVALISRKKDAALDTVERIKEQGGQAVSFIADCTKQDQTHAVFHQIMKEFGKLDILHCNMGHFRTSPIEKITEKDWDEMLSLNLKAKFLTVQAALPYLIKNGSGSIILTAAVFGSMLTTKNMAHYNASKAAVISLTKSLALELAPRQIRVNCVCPGQMSHQMFTKGKDSLRTNPLLFRDGLPEDAAFSILYFASDESAWVTGTTLVVDGGTSIGIGKP
ncbi:MAG: hypothetical protein A3I11_00680 [Elusimicrobia bacterium RIFCSPLOWO2_02_FULL_39_32]|nr:MAG: hypothetical protein A2034_06230 [Elusimicrobia bacterium GWA2_38_7]OGR78962.1 MAG: hypothetical protein A3B80_07705 [Elusimicrobia bacterium RIFCSPHIGHO2_02_FULL_39_36]OGR92546.1 MAG: hypothetical protein A3I11_00680 [Elusimicrobia bacterium RIFCSPLOWO2_02_FULL_39_32]OGR99194.1 MAG: hypothetical protein A3G85_05890 [Elusimicrobia bacterium RIFCSPLOWO2_12_FULL_39_28]